MHSRVFQLNNEPIEDYNLAQEYDLDNFVGSVADYVMLDEDKLGSISWLQDRLEGVVDFSDDRESFTVKDKEHYFKAKYENFLEACKKAQDLTFEDFMKITCMTAFYINEWFDEEYSFYVYINECVYTLDRFMRCVENGETYYIGSIFDYHF